MDGADLACLLRAGRDPSSGDTPGSSAGKDEKEKKKKSATDEMGPTESGRETWISHPWFVADLADVARRRRSSGCRAKEEVVSHHLHAHTDRRDLRSRSCPLGFFPPPPWAPQMNPCDSSGASRLVPREFGSASGLGVAFAGRGGNGATRGESEKA